MGWMESLVSIAINTAASVLDTAGSIACSVGGMGFAAAQAMDKTFQASYAGSSAYLLSDFFAKKELEARDRRLIKAARKTVFSIQDGNEQDALFTLQV